VASYESAHDHMGRDTYEARAPPRVPLQVALDANTPDSSGPATVKWLQL